MIRNGRQLDPPVPTLSVHITIRIWSIKENWSLDPPMNRSVRSLECTIHLLIEGDGESGYHLVMCIADHHAVDTWHESQRDALELAEEMFGVRASE